LLLGIAISVILVFTLLLGGGTFAVRQLNEGYVYARLQQDALALLAAIRTTPDGQLRLRARRLSPAYEQPFSGHYFVILGRAGELDRSRSLWDETLPIPWLEAGQMSQDQLAGPADQQLLLYAAGFKKLDQAVTIAVAEDVTPLARQIRRYQGIAAGACAFLLLVLLLLQQRLVRRALLQLDEVRDDVRRVGAGELTALSEAVPSEVQPLVHEFNRLLELLAQRILRSRRALGNLAHAIKTPLSLLAAELGRTAVPNRPLALNQVNRIRQLVDRELRRARIAGGGGLPGQQFDADQDIPPLLESIRLLHRDKTLDIEADWPPGIALPIDREDALELLGNLLDNAGKWARQHIRLEIDPSQEDLSIEIADDGPGVAEADLPQLANRGARIDENSDGHGLGLAIVGDIVKSYGGALEFARSTKLGGLSGRIVLPLRRFDEHP
jgi:signal transduction histidine kinase